MAWFLVQTVYDQGKYAEVRPRHREYLAKLAAEGTVAVAGPFADDSGGVFLIQAEDADSLQAVLDADPYVVEGALESFTVREFKPTLGAWVQ
ncbi:MULTISPECIES: YciI family protein [Amycolatopsis]|uniref:YciI family protein n=1 Tax=Amycolatopsis tucumanensis TaxID=401106 RepID=A0ABP7HVP0_9PSEU|nr:MULTISPECIES: YciI family protein [Amycolatopsis]MCF6421888.1 YciI family protein [Amycolatopsis tucumanensis]